MVSFKGEGANRSALGDIERSGRPLDGLGGIFGEFALSLPAPLDGRGGTAGVACVVAAVMVFRIVVWEAGKKKKTLKIN